MLVARSEAPPLHYRAGRGEVADPICLRFETNEIDGQQGRKKMSMPMWAGGRGRTHVGGRMKGLRWAPQYSKRGLYQVEQDADAA
jgi:hypothetical protein